WPSHTWFRLSAGFRVRGSGFRVQGSGFRVQVLGLRNPQSVQTDARMGAIRNPQSTGLSMLSSPPWVSRPLPAAAIRTSCGGRIQCARCHNHPYEKWTQNQYYQMASFFARVKARKGEFKDEQLVLVSTRGEVTNPRTQKQARPCALDSSPVPAGFAGDRREP